MPMGKRSTLAAAADRLDRLVQDIKRQQYDATGLRRIPLPPRPGPDPQADWAKRFAVWTLKSLRERANTPAATVLARPLAGQPKKPVFPEPPPLDGRALAVEKQVQHSGHIGAVLGKAGPRRGLFNRLFRRDN
jgi:hypothetical protein